MQIIKLDATTSTNTYLKEMGKEKDLEDFTVVVCKHQVRGRGQKGNAWIVEKGKNLTFSVLKRFENLRAQHAFVLNAAVSLAIFDVLKALKTPKLTVKWPNDIMSGNEKLCGILIENSLLGEKMKHSIIGVGLNVNQERFENLPHATSIKLKTGGHLNLEALLQDVLVNLDGKFKRLAEGCHEETLIQYEALLFRKGVPSTYVRTIDSKRFEGILLGITSSGQLRVQDVNGHTENFWFKELAFVY